MEKVWKRYGYGILEKEVSEPIAVVDRGIDVRHPEFADRVVWRKDFRGVHYDFEFDNQYPSTHGTHVAGIIGAGIDGNGIIGVSPLCEFCFIEVLGFSDAGFQEVFREIRMSESTVANFSVELGKPNNGMSIVGNEQITKTAKKCLIVLAAGNDSKIITNDYTTHPDVLPVGVCNINDKIPSYMNRGEHIVLVAPSQTGLPMADWRGSRGKNTTDYTHDVDGTSFGAPLVAGVAHYIQEVVAPGISPKDLKELLIQTARPIDEHHRCLDAWEACKKAAA